MSESPIPSPAGPAGPRAESAEWLPSGGGSGLLRVHGRREDGAGVPLPALVVRAGGEEHRFASLPDARFSRDPGAWRGSYLVPAALVEASDATAALEWQDGARAALPPLPARAPEPEPAPAPGARVIDRAVLVERRARRAEAAGEAQARLATEALAAAEVLERRAGALERHLEALAAERDAARAEARAAEGAAAAAGARTRVEAVARAAVEAELEREQRAGAALGEALEAERAARRSAEAGLRAARAAHRAEAEARTLLAGELDAERAAHAVTRAGAGALGEALAAARAEGVAARARIAELDRALDDERARRLHAEAAALPARPERAALRERALVQAAAAASVRAGGPAPPERLVADLDAAAAALRARAEDAPAPAGELAAPEPLPPAPALRAAVAALAAADPPAAARLVVALAPAQGALLPGPLEYDLTVRGLGTFAVSVPGDEAPARVEPLARPRRRRDAVFHLRAEAAPLAAALAGAPLAPRRFRGPVRLRGRREGLAALGPLAAATPSAAAVARAGAALAPADVYGLLPHAIPAAWTAGHAWAVLQRVTGEPGGSWLVQARDGAGVDVQPARADQPADASVTLSAATFARLLRAEPVPAGERPAVRGDRAAVAALWRWLEQLRGA